MIIKPTQIYSQPDFTREFGAIINGQYISGAFHGGMASTKPSFVDIDADGDYDLFIGNEHGTITFFENSGTIQTPQWDLVTDLFLDIDYTYTATAPEFADIDADGDYDLFISNAISIYNNIGSNLQPIFQEQNWNHPEGEACNRYPITFADIDADGDLDLFSGYEGGYCDGEVHYWENIGTPDSVAWGPEDTLYNGIDVGSVSAPALCDIDDDGDLDLFVGEAGGNIWFYRNDGTPQEPTWTFVTTQYAGIDLYYASASPRFVDIDGDGDFDLFIGVSSWYNDNIRFYENIGTPLEAQWQEHEDFMLYLDFGSQTHPELVDIDADGDIDILTGVGGIFGGGTVLLKHEGTPSEQQWTIHYTALPTNEPTFCDIDHDGDFDLFYLNDGPLESVIFYENVGTPEEGEWVLADNQFIPYEPDWDDMTGPTDKIDFADIDGDGDYDFFVGTMAMDLPGYNGGRLWFSENTGTPENPAFGVPDYYTNIDVGEQSYVTLSDVDGDGDYDLLIISDQGRHYFENVGTAQVSEWSLVTTDFLGSSNCLGAIYAFGDVDGNGTQDLVVGGIRGGLCLYLNEGDVAVDDLGDTFQAVPEFLHLRQNFPNPFNAETTIEYLLVGPSRVSMTLYDIQGRTVTTWKKDHRSGGVFRPYV